MNSENLHRLALAEVQSLTEFEEKKITKKNMMYSIHKLLPILIYLGENEFFENLSEIKKIKNLNIQKNEFQKACKFIREKFSKWAFI